VSFGVNWDNGLTIDYSFKAGATLGLGGSVSTGGKLYINPPKVVEGVSNAIDWAGDAIDGASDWAYDTYADASDWVSSKADSAWSAISGLWK